MLIQHPIEKLWDIVGTVVEIGRYRDYLVKLPCGKTYWRNRRFLRPVHDSLEGRAEGAGGY